MYPTQRTVNKYVNNKGRYTNNTHLKYVLFEIYFMNITFEYFILKRVYIKIVIKYKKKYFPSWKTVSILSVTTSIIRSIGHVIKHHIIVLWKTFIECVSLIHCHRIFYTDLILLFFPYKKNETYWPSNDLPSTHKYSAISLGNPIFLYIFCEKKPFSWKYRRYIV